MTSHSRMTPDWVMLGLAADDGVYIYASSDLTEAELESVAEQREIPSNGVYRRFEAVNHRIILGATMKTLVVVKGDTYGEALRTLLNTWTPPEPEYRAIGEGQSALPL